MKNMEPRPLAEKHPQIIIFCGCFIVDTVNRLSYRLLAGLRTRLRRVPNWQNILSSLNMTRDHWPVVQFLYFWQNWSLFVTCFELRSGFRAACRLQSLNSSQRRHLTVLRLAFTHGTSFLTSEALRNGCFLITLSTDMSSLRVVHLNYIDIGHKPYQPQPYQPHRRRYRPQAKSISATRYRPQTFSKSAVIIKRTQLFNLCFI